MTVLLAPSLVIPNAVWESLAVFFLASDCHIALLLAMTVLLAASLVIPNVVWESLAVFFLASDCHVALLLAMTVLYVFSNTIISLWNRINTDEKSVLKYANYFLNCDEAILINGNIKTKDEEYYEWNN